MLRHLLKGRFLGHPVHPMLVHFPTALFTVSFLFDLIGTWYSIHSLFTASFYCIGAGLAGGILAALFGLVDYIGLTECEPLFRKATRHALLQFTVLILFGLVFGLRFEQSSEFYASGTTLAVSGVGVIVMLIGNYLGGELVFREGVGVHKQ